MYLKSIIFLKSGAKPWSIIRLFSKMERTRDYSISMKIDEEWAGEARQKNAVKNQNKNCSSLYYERIEDFVRR